MLAEDDRLFPIAGGEAELAAYSSASDKQLKTVKEAGHVFFLHPAGKGAVSYIIEWLGRRADKFLPCRPGP